MNLSLVSFVATDNVELPGLIYAPPKPTTKVAVWLHGMSSSVFYAPTFMNALGESLTDKNIALMTFNNRGAYNSKSLRIADETLPEEDSRYPGGAHFELISDCVKDIDGAVDFLRERNFSEFYLLGHSTGANKICAYHVRAKVNPFSKYVLAGPGDDSGLYFEALGTKRFWKALNYAARAVTNDNPLHIMPKYTGMYPFSVQSAWDILNPEGPYSTFPFYEYATERLGKKPLFEEYQKIDKPTLVIFGDQDEYATTAGGADKALDIMIKHTSNSMLKQIDFQLVPDADHSFHDAETAFAGQVSEWLS